MSSILRSLSSGLRGGYVQNSGEIEDIQEIIESNFNIFVLLYF